MKYNQSFIVVLFVSFSNLLEQIGLGMQFFLGGPFVSNLNGEGGGLAGSFVIPNFTKTLLLSLYF